MKKVFLLMFAFLFPILLRCQNDEIKKLEKLFAPYISTYEDMLKLIPFKKNNLWGYMEKGTKKVLIKPQFGYASPMRIDQDLYYSDILIINQNRSFFWAINANGRIIDEGGNNVSRYTMSNKASYLESPSLKQEKTELGFVNIERSSYSYSKEYTSFQPFKLGDKFGAIVNHRGKLVAINEKGRLFYGSMDLLYKQVIPITNNYNLLCFFTQKNDDSWEILDMNLKVIKKDLINSPKLEVYKTVKKYLIIINEGGKCGVINHLGELLINIKYEKIINTFVTKIKEDKLIVLALVQQNGQEFIVDENGIEYK